MFFVWVLCQDVDIYFMDELFVGVDVVMEWVIMMFLVEFKEKGKIVFVVYYDL